MTDDRDIDTALARATRPRSPPGAVERLLAKAAPRGAAVVPFRAPAKPRLWPAAALLAASLAAGVFLGAAGLTEGFYPETAGLDDPSDLAGVGEAIDAADEGAT